MERSVILVGIMLVVGCNETRFLSWIPRRSAVEVQSYDLHDPFPDDDIGPKTYSRPRTFDEPRTETRKTYDLRSLRGARAATPQSHVYWDPRGKASIQPSPTTTSIAIDEKWDDPVPRYNVVPQ